MQPSRIALRRGCALFIGEPPDLPMHAHSAAAVCVGLDRSISVRGPTDSRWSKCRSVLVPAGVEHELALVGSRFAVMYFDPGSPIYAGLGPSTSAASSTSGYTCDPPWSPGLLEDLRSIDVAPPSECSRLLERILSGFAVRMDIEMDDRLRMVASELLKNPGDARTAEQLAASVGMSPSWLQHAFKNRFGVPPRRFREWFRIKVAVVLIRRGLPLAEAAPAAGFYDQAHFTNKFRETFGLTPGMVFGDYTNIHWDIENEELTEKLSAELLASTHGSDQESRPAIVESNRPITS